MTPSSSDAELAERLQKLETVLSQMTLRPPTEERVADRVLAVLAEKASHGPLVPAPIRVIPTYPEAPPGTIVHPQEGGGFRSLFLASLWTDLKFVPRMYFDPRYRLSRIAQIGVPVIAALFALNYLFFNYMFVVPVVQQICERLFCILLAVILYRILARETLRYQQVLEYLNRFGH